MAGNENELARLVLKTGWRLALWGAGKVKDIVAKKFNDDSERSHLPEPQVNERKNRSSHSDIEIRKAFLKKEQQEVNALRASIDSERSEIKTLSQRIIDVRACEIRKWPPKESGAVSVFLDTNVFINPEFSIILDLLENKDERLHCAGGIYIHQEQMTEIEWIANPKNRKNISLDERDLSEKRRGVRRALDRIGRLANAGVVAAPEKLGKYSWDRHVHSAFDAAFCSYAYAVSRHEKVVLVSDDSGLRARVPVLTGHDKESRLVAIPAQELVAQIQGQESEEALEERIAAHKVRLEQLLRILVKRERRLHDPRIEIENEEK